MSREELKRVKVLERVAFGSMSTAEAAESLGVTPRQFRRLKAKYTKEGEEGLIHGNRGRKPKHALSDELRSLVVRLHDEKYSDSNFCHCSDLLREHEGVNLSPSSIGRILKSAGKVSKRSVKRRSGKHRLRNRRSQAGMLWQTDATPYEWLGKELGRFALHAVIDDATGLVTGAVFTRNECAQGYSIALRQGIEKYGLPLALYTDKHTIFRSPNEKLTIDEELNGEEIPLSNFGKALVELRIEHIKANTPQAKGRIERLWETLQDRLPVELRLLNVKDIEEANKALPELIAEHNRKYAVLAADEGVAYLPLGKGTCLAHVFAIRETRKIGGGCSLSYKGSSYVPDDSRVCFDSRTTVEVRETYGGEVMIWDKGRAIKLRKMERSSRCPKEEANRTSASTGHKPAENHPWRGRRQLNKSQMSADMGIGV